MTRRKYDTLVVGGGIVGLASAHALAERGQRVAVVEKAGVGGGTTTRTFAWLNASSKVADEPYHRLNAMGCARYRAFAAEHVAERVGWHQTSMLYSASRGDEASYTALRDQTAYLEQYSYPAQPVEAAALAAMEPAVVFDNDVTGLHATSEAWLDTPRFTAFLAEELRASGHDVLEHCRAQTLELSDDGTVSGLTTDQGLLQTSQILLCAGPDTPQVLADLTGYDAFASRFPMNRVPGLLVQTPPITGGPGLSRIIYFEGSSDAFHIRPAANGGLLMGADDIDGLVAEDSDQADMEAAGARLLDRARKRLPGPLADITAQDCTLAIGVRPYPQDGKTLAGALPGSRGLYLVATHSGITLAPALGHLIATLMVDGETPEALQPFALERLPGFS